MILLIDNYDSFVHNLARYFARLGHKTKVVRNDAIDAAGVRRLAPAAVVLSPGPCTPAEAGVSAPLVREIENEFPILGVRLGHQCIAAAYGASIARAAEPMHGRTSHIEHDRRGIFQDLPSPLVVCRYHSLVVDESTLSAELEITARAKDGSIMALRHRRSTVVGLQFHPEAILTNHGYRLLANFLRLAGLEEKTPPADLGELRQRPPVVPTPTTPVTF